VPWRDVLSLSDSDVERYKQVRQEVRTRTVEADLVALRTMLNWATRQRNSQGRPLLEYNPMRGVRLPTEKNPRRPVETYDRYLALMAVAPEVDWRLQAALTLAESTGQRISSVLALQRRDIDLVRKPHGWLHFRAEHQKNGHEHWVPITEDCSLLLVAHAEAVGSSSPTAWLFPSEHDSTRPVDLFRVSKLLREAYALAELETLKGGLWHPWRRKWATERKNMPLRDVAEAGGWRDPNTLLKRYMQPDEATMTRVVLEPGKLREA